jgi:hypothetical protein
VRVREESALAGRWSLHFALLLFCVLNEKLHAYEALTYIHLHLHIYTETQETHAPGEWRRSTHAAAKRNMSSEAKK